MGHFDLRLPSRNVADKLMGLYFTHFETLHRIIHIPTFQDDCDKLWNRQDNPPTDQCLLVLLVIAIGASVEEETPIGRGLDPSFRQDILHLVHAAQTWLHGPTEKERLSIRGIQIHCLVILARQIFSIGGDLVWLSLGSLTNMALQMGLHRDPKYLPAMTLLQAETRRRLWATVLELIAQASLDCAMPPRLCSDDFDTEAPGNYNDKDLVESSSRIPHATEVYTSASMQLLLLNSLPLRLEIASDSQKLRSAMTYRDALALSSRLRDVQSEVISTMETWQGYGVSLFHINYANLLISRFMIPLVSPFALVAREQPLYHYALKLCLDFSIAIMDFELGSSWQKLMTRGSGMFREAFWYSLSITIAEFLADVRACPQKSLLSYRVQQRTELKHSLLRLIVHSTERIRQGETNVKPHMFLNMIKAEVEALECQNSVEIAVARAGLDSLKASYQMIQDGSISVSLTPESVPVLEPDLGIHFDLDPDFDSIFLGTSIL